MLGSMAENSHRVKCTVTTHCGIFFKTFSATTHRGYLKNATMRSDTKEGSEHIVAKEIKARMHFGICHNVF